MEWVMQDLQLGTTRRHGHSRSRRIGLISTRLQARKWKLQWLRLQLLWECKGSMLGSQFSCCCTHTDSSSTRSGYLLFLLNPKIPRYRSSQLVGYIFLDRGRLPPRQQQLRLYCLLVRPYLSCFFCLSCLSCLSSCHQRQPLRVVLPLVIRLLLVIQRRALVLLRFLPWFR